MGDVFTASTLFSYTSRVLRAKVVGREAVPPTSITNCSLGGTFKPLQKVVQFMLTTGFLPSYTPRGSSSNPVSKKGIGVTISFALRQANLNDRPNLYEFGIIGLLNVGPLLAKRRFVAVLS